MSYPVKDIIVVGAGSAGLMSAILCKKYFKNLDLNVKIVQSGRVPILGVGEGTTEHIQFFIKHAGINEYEFITESKATLKSGVLFKDWLYPGHEYAHSLMCYHVECLRNEDGEYDYTSPFHQHGMPLKGYGAYIYGIKDKDNEVEGRLEGSPFQYHFNNFALNDYLRKKCAEFGIEIVDDHITEIIKHDDGRIRAIKGNETHEADFFFDCTGFRKLLISEYQPDFVDYSDQLIVDSALFFPYKTIDNPMPMTLSKAMKYGWFWQAPTQDRTGNGYVFSSKHCTPQMALDEVRELGFDLPDETVNNIKTFKTGHIKQGWSKNVVAIGLSSGFFEPMEAAALSTGILQTLTTLEYLHAYSVEDNAVQRIYNRVFDKYYKNAFYFIRMHYIVDREDTSFWKEYKEKPLPEELEDILTLYQKRPSTWIEHDLPMPFVLYGPDNFVQVMAGLQLIDGEAWLNYLDHHKLKDITEKEARALYVMTSVRGELKKGKNHNELLQKIKEESTC